MRHSRLLEWVYARFAKLFLHLHPFWNLVGYGRAEAPVKFVERRVKGLLFDCRMCGTVHPLLDRHVLPDELPQAAPERALRRRARQRPLRGGAGHALRLGAGLGGQPQHAGRRRHPRPQKPVDYSLRETSAWLRVTAQTAAAARGGEGVILVPP